MKNNENNNPSEPREDGRKNNGKHKAFVDRKWKPGQSGNPNGRPKGKTLSEEIRYALAEEIKGGGGLTYMEAIAKVIIKEALKGKFPYTKEILERMEGKVADKTEITGSGGDPIQILDLSNKEKRDSFYRLLSGATHSRNKRPGGIRNNGE